jgi:hypothetical protein
LLAKLESRLKFQGAPMSPPVPSFSAMRSRLEHAARAASTRSLRGPAWRRAGDTAAPSSLVCSFKTMPTGAHQQLRQLSLAFTERQRPFRGSERGHPVCRPWRTASGVVVSSGGARRSSDPAALPTRPWSAAAARSAWSGAAPTSARKSPGASRSSPGSPTAAPRWPPRSAAARWRSRRAAFRGPSFRGKGGVER